MPEENHVNLSIRFPKKEYEEMKVLSKSKGITTSTLARIFLLEALLDVSTKNCSIFKRQEGDEALFER